MLIVTLILIVILIVIVILILFYSVSLTWLIVIVTDSHTGTHLQYHTKSCCSSNLSSVSHCATQF